MANLDGWRKNWDVVKKEIKHWWFYGIPAPWQEFRDARGFREKLHKAANLVGESIPYLRRTLMYILIYSFVINWGVLIWLLWFRDTGCPAP